MRQAVAAQVSNPYFELGEEGLRQILSDVIEEVRRSVSQDIDGAEILHSLLNSPWLQSLLKVYGCLQRYLRNSPTPVLEYASGLSLQLLIDIRSSPCCSEEAKELYRLLRQPHMQALLSAHDTVAQKDYEPVLPPMPEELPDDEEATRTVCLVKNKQPLLSGHHRFELPGASPPCGKRSRGGLHSHWCTLLQRDEAFGVQSPKVESLKESPWCDVWTGSCPSMEQSFHPAGPRRYRPPGHKPMCPQIGCSKPKRQSSIRYTNLLWEQRFNHSAPSVYSSVRIDNIIENRAASSPHWTTSSPCFAVPCYPGVDGYHHPSLPRRLQSPRIHTAPPSPMHPHRLLDEPPVNVTKQHSLDELRTTMQLAANSMESSTKDIKLLGEKMAAATERMTEMAQDNSQAVVLLTQVVDRLRTLLTSSRTDLSSMPADTEQNSSFTQRSRCLSSCSSGNSLETPSTSQATGCHSGSCHGSLETLKIKNTSLQQKKHNHTEPKASRHPLTNGLFDETEKISVSLKGRRKKKKKRN